MNAVFEVSSWISLVALLALLVLKGFALVNALTWSSQAYEAAGKLTKPAWTIILGIGFAVEIVLLSPISILSLVFTVAAIVYVVDVRPALRGLVRR